MPKVHETHRASRQKTEPHASEPLRHGANIPMFRAWDPQQGIIMKQIKTLLALALVVPFLVASVNAQSQPSAKVTAKTASFTLLPKVSNTTATQMDGDWVTLLSNKIKVANQKDLFIGTSFEVGLYTRTLVRSKLMVTDSSTAVAKVEVRVQLTDGAGNVTVVQPGPVTFGRRSQTLSATLEGAIFSGVNGTCLTATVNADGTISFVLDEDCVQPEEIELILDTMDAAAFNFVATDVPQGIQTVTVQARVSVNGTLQNGEYEATALIGKGSMTVESIRLIKGEDVVLPEL